MGIYYIAGMAYDSNYLEHHGIKGQKWGIRRFQNPDGSLTEEGKRRFNYNSKDARVDLGFKEKGHLNSMQKHMSRMYKAYTKAAVRAGNRGDKAAAKGKDPTKHYNRGLSFMNSAKQYKNMAKTYNSLSTKEQKKINRGMNFAKTSGLLLFGGVGQGIYEGLYANKMKKRLS